MTPAPTASWWKSPAALAAALGIATLLAYWPALRGGFIFDDNVFLTENPLIHAADGLRRLWFSREPLDYWPVTSSTLWLEWRLWGTNAAGYHATNVALHLASVLLFWAVLRRLGVPGAFLGALVFALHPVNAESVAWITERKNLLALLFFLLSVFWFVGSEVERVDPNALDRRRTPESALRSTRSTIGNKYYALSLAAFVLAMLSKGSTVILPLVLLGIVAWRGASPAVAGAAGPGPASARPATTQARRRSQRQDILRLAPFFLFAAGLAFFESRFSTVIPAAEMAPLGWLERLLRAGGVVWFYLGKALWPAGLCFDYGEWNVRPDAASWWIPLLAAGALTAVLWHYRRTWSRPALFGWGYFCAALLPVLGFAEVGFMRFSPVSNHFAHLAVVGVAALAGAGGAWLAERVGKTIFFGVAAAALVFAGSLTWQQGRIYADATTLYRDTIARNPASWIARNNLGALLGNAGQDDEAIAVLAVAVWLKPERPEARNNLGLAFYRAGHWEEAGAQYEEALHASPGFFRARNNLGVVLARLDRLPEAIAQFEEALRLEPGFGEAQQNLARAQRLWRERTAAR